MHRLRLGFLRSWSCRSGPCGLVLALVVLLLGRAAWGQQRPSMASPSTASQFVRTQWTAVDEGMPSNGVRDIIQTEGGYLWLGTKGGLARFDGTAFEETRFTRHEAESRIIDRILDLQAYSGGLLVLYRSRDLLHYRPDRVRTVAEAVWAHQVGRDGRLWIGTEAGVSVYEDSTRTRLAPEHIEATVRALRRTAVGTLWVGTGCRGLFQLRPSTFSVYGTEEGLPSNKVITIARRRDSSVWMGTRAGGISSTFGTGSHGHTPWRRMGGPFAPFSPSTKTGPGSSGWEARASAGSRTDSAPAPPWGSPACLL